MRLFEWLWPCRRIESTTVEAKAQLAKIEDQDPAVQVLAAELRAAKRRNNFSAMVEATIRQRSRSQE